MAGRSGPFYLWHFQRDVQTASSPRPLRAIVLTLTFSLFLLTASHMPSLRDSGAHSCIVFQRGLPDIALALGYCLTVLAVGLAPQESLITAFALVPRSEQLGQRAGVPGRLWLLLLSPCQPGCTHAHSQSMPGRACLLLCPWQLLLCPGRAGTIF